MKFQRSLLLIPLLSLQLYKMQIAWMQLVQLVLQDALRMVGARTAHCMILEYCHVITCQRKSTCPRRRNRHQLIIFMRSFLNWRTWWRQRLAKEEQRKGTSSWRTLWLNSMKSGVAGLEVEQPSFDSVWERAVGQPYLNNSRWCPSTWDIFCWWKPTS